MRFSKVNNPGATVAVREAKYKIDWERKVSGPQLKVKQFLQPYWENDYVLEEFLLPGSRLRGDLINLTWKIFLEVSPASVHRKFNKFMHKSRGRFGAVIRRDESKRLWAVANGFNYVELRDEHLKSLSVATFKELGIEL